jgi:hypothetical protein
MGELRGIAGIKSGAVRCQIVSHRTEALQILRKGLAITSAGESGSISAWICDDGTYRASFDQWGVTKDARVFRAKSHLSGWLARWWRAMGDQNKLAPLTPP